MGCCCSDVGVAGKPNDVPDPPPLCDILLEPRTIQRGKLGGWNVVDAPISGANDIAWSNFDSKDWGALQPSGATPGPFFSVQGVGQAGPRPGGIRFEINSVLYAASRLITLVPLVLSEGGTQYSLRQLYAADTLQMVLSGSLTGLATSGGVPDGFGPLVSGTYSQLWSALEVRYGLISTSDLQTPANPLTSPLTAAHLADGAESLATTLLASPSVPFASVASGVTDSGSVSVDLSSLVDVTGGDLLCFVVKVPESKQSVTTTAPSGIAYRYNIDEMGPDTYNSVFNKGFAWSLSMEITGYDLLASWPCVLSLSLRIDINQNSSTIIEEDRMSSATYLSGTGSTKKLRSQDDNTAPLPISTTSYTSSGSFSVPASVTSVTVRCWGGGGGGGGGDFSDQRIGSGGGGGAYAEGDIAVTPSTSETVTVGAAGSAGISPNSGTAGGDTWFSGSGVLKAGGGKEGGQTSAPYGGAGGTASGSGLSKGFSGGLGGDSEVGPNDAGGGGGGAAGTAGSGFAGADGSGTTGGAGGAANGTGGAGGAGGSTGATGSAGGTYGGGGGGGAEGQDGGAGGAGLVEIDYSTGSGTITRQCDVYLTNSGGKDYINFDYHREASPADANYYIEPSTPFKTEIAGTTGIDTISDLEGLVNTFTHTGTNNVTTSKGTVDATVKITIEKVTISNTLP